MVKDPLPQRGQKYRQRVYKQTKNITEEQALKNMKEKARRLAEKMGWNDDWHKKKADLGKKRSHKNRVNHSVHGK